VRRVVLAGAVVAALYVAVMAGVYAGQRRLLFVPNTGRPRAGDVGAPGLREVELLTSDGLRLLAWYAPGPAGAPVLAYFHGNGGNLGDRAARIRQFAKDGLGVLMPEYRGYGGNPGSPSEAGFALDAKAAMAVLAAQGVPPGRTVIYGESIGTGVAVRVAVEQGPVAAVILESPYTSITDIARERFWFLPVGLLIRDPFDSLGRIGRLRSPLLVLQGGRDAVVTPALGQRLFRAAPEPKEVWVAAEAGHENLMRFGAEAVITDYIRRHVPGRP
jgi:fermentation-respiration switch protein FrsA (DUF1100 family)